MIILANNKSNGSNHVTAVVDDFYTVRMTRGEIKRLLGNNPGRPVTTQSLHADLKGNNGEIYSSITGATVKFHIDADMPDSIGRSEGYAKKKTISIARKAETPKLPLAI